MALYAAIKCNCCVFRLMSAGHRLWLKAFVESCGMNNLTSTPAVDAVRRTPSSRWILASLALSMLLPSLDTSIANAGWA